MKKLLVAMTLIGLWVAPALADLRVTPKEKQLGVEDTNEQIYEVRTDDRFYIYDASEGSSTGFYYQESTGNLLLGEPGDDSRAPAGAKLELSSVDSGLLISRANANQWAATSNDEVFGMLRVNITTSDLEFYNGAVWLSCTKSAS